MQHTLSEPNKSPTVQDIVPLGLSFSLLSFDSQYQRAQSIKPTAMASTAASPPRAAGDHPRVLLRGFLSRETCKVLSPSSSNPLFL